MKMLSLNCKGKDLINTSDETKNQRRENDRSNPTYEGSLQQKSTKTESQRQNIQQQSYSIK